MVFVLPEAKTFLALYSLLVSDEGKHKFDR